jgi:hypothetical protein
MGFSYEETWRIRGLEAVAWAERRPIRREQRTAQWRRFLSRQRWLDVVRPHTRKMKEGIKKFSR